MLKKEPSTTSHKTPSRWCYIVLVMVLAAAWSISLVADRGQAVDARPLTMAQRHAPAPGSLRLYVFDCGKLSISDPSLYGFTKDDLATTDMSVACFLVAHPKGTLMWDVGVLPDSVFESQGGAVTQGRATVFRSLEAQLAEVGYISADITYLAMSHYHWDHTANANDFAGSTWIVEKADRDAMFADRPPRAANIIPDHYSALRNSKTVILTGADYDLFGDGTVIIKFAPGHTPGHQLLFLELPKTGPVVLSGDLYHYPEERAQHRVPSTEFNREHTAATRVAIEAFVEKTGAQLWIQRDFRANAKLKKAPGFYE